MPRTRRGIILATLLLAVMATACDDTTDQAPPTLGAEVTLPLDRYLLTPPEVKRVAAAHRTQLARCVRRFGIAVPWSSSSPTMPVTLNERRYGITDPAQAATAGYRLTAQPPTPSASPSASAPDPDLLAVLKGDGPRTIRGQRVPAGGCYGEAQRALTAGAPAGTDTALAQRLAAESYQKSGQDARVRDVIAAWSRCMRTHGHQYPGPLDPPADPRFRNGAVTPAEIATATADLACKRQTNLVGIWAEVESSYQRRQITANAPALERLRRWNEAQLKAAR